MTILPSLFLGGFECSTQRRADGRRLDLSAATGHDRNVTWDYAALRALGVGAARDGLRWHLIERAPGRYDWSSWLPMLRAARDAQITVIWDLCHYGWPDDIDIWRPGFVERFRRFAAAAAEVHAAETGLPPLWCPVNEISFWAWAGGDKALFAPAARNQAPELKRQLVRAALAACEALRGVDARARLVHADPAIHVVADAFRPHDEIAAEAFRTSMFEAWDMISGRLCPELGGEPRWLDVVGVNYYSNNQWILGGATLGLGHVQFRPFHKILQEIAARYARPLLVTETGAEGENGPGWLRYVGGEVRDAMALGVPVEGICLYPVLDYPGWEDERHCECGLLAAGPGGQGRRVRGTMAVALAQEQDLFRRLATAPRRVAAGD